MNYSIISIICIIALLINAFNVFENELFSIRHKKKLIWLSGIIAFEIILDSIAFMIDGNRVDKIVEYKIIKTIEFIIAPIIPAILSNMITSRFFWKKIRIIFSILIIINFVFQLLAIFIPIMFFIDQNAVYHRASYSYIYVVILAMCFILLIISANNTFTQNTTKINGTLYAMNLFLLFGTVIRVIYSKSNADWLCITLSYFIFIIYFSNSYLKIDAITSLLNRKAFNTKLSQINYNTALIIIDANKFKSINDSYGHQNGDLALYKIAESILKVYGKVGYCYRIGGDEFCVILKPAVLKNIMQNSEISSIYSMLDKLANSLNKSILDESKKFEILKFGVSQGYGIYLSSSENSIEDIFNFADKNMYKEKIKGE